MVRIRTEGWFGADYSSDRLSLKCLHTLQTVLRNSEFQGYDPVTDGSATLKQNRAMDQCVAEVHRTCQELGIDLKRIGPNLGHTVEALLVPHRFYPRARKSLSGIAIDDVGTTCSLAVRELVRPGSMESVVIQTVFGGQEQYPIRALSYLLPALHFAESIRRSGKFKHIPLVRYVFMQRAGILLNGLDEARVTGQTRDLIRISREYVKEFYPELAPWVLFATDEIFMSDPSIRELYSSLMEDQSIRSDEYTAGILARFDTQHTNVLPYAMLHPIVHDIHHPSGLFPDISGISDNSQPSMIINVGGQAEKTFFRIRRAMTQRLVDMGIPIQQTMQLFSSHQVPPYMKLTHEEGRMDDPTVRQALERPRLATDVLYEDTMSSNLLMRDMDLLVRDSSISYLQEFLRSMNI